ncbi:LysR family transcriptional regulator [Roseateles puraquae]|jgi:DNA-binding transcriptional LysR family regulator|uniref:LysR family transcriptional regulator n=1 Tax=Roseateles puraquae TaxID=431059 RepID=A0A254N962_9BURK|nr:LysR family transcriptional regulator [Roseateles puraquae]MDG0854845.1 LysR family transcriptional regulator [Roseateles puraquae]OWR04571.1 LysR family transcriptional regulator [Roseateles puraquae]
MDQLRAIKVFVRVIDEGSFAGAARALDLAPAVVTRLVAELEEHLGARLLNRTTRRLSLTEIGDAYLERARRILADVEEAAALAASATQEVRGLLRVLCPPAIAVHQLAKHLPKFHRDYPAVTLEITSPGPVSTVDDSYDLTIFLTREVPDGDFIARLLARSEFIMCASPEYLDRRGRPEHPRDLKQHDALLPPTAALARGLTLQSGDGSEEITLPIVPSRAALATTHMDTNYAAALHGLGVAGLPSFIVEDALLEQALERVMPQWRLFGTTIWAGMPTRKYVPARTRAFLDFLLEVFGGEDKDPWLVAAGCATRA